MTIAPTRPILWASIAFGALVGISAIPSGSGWAADPTTATDAPANPSGMSNQNTALDAVAQARMALKYRQARNALEQIERAERALLNIQQIHQDSHIADALQRLAMARAALDASDMVTVDQQLAAVSQELATNFASTPAPGTAPNPAVGDAIYDANGQEIGPVLTFVVDPNSQVQTLIINVGDYVGTADKTVAIPRDDITGDRSHLTLNRNKEQLSRAQNYWGAGTGVGSSTPPRQ
jgi:hypothetical protein